MEKHIIFRMHAYSDAAGKSSPNAVRGGNEDNFYVDDNLCDEFPSRCESDVEKELCEYGLIMAVADGMGGMNAGEVASEIAVNTVRDFFSPGRINATNARDHESRKNYLERLIVEADNRIKQDAKSNPEHAGMGSTLILAWIVGNEMTLSWCGDSRAYRFNPVTGIELVSEDHSFVQELVKKGILTYDQTFEHPQGNIVTRSLGDESRQAQPETRFFTIYDHDIIMLCSDGLSGVLRDRKTPCGNGQFFPGENLEDIIRSNHDSLVICRQALWRAAEAADWYDNVTAILCEIKSGAGEMPVSPRVNEGDRGASSSFSDDPMSKTVDVKTQPFWSKTLVHVTPKGLVYALIAFLLLVAGGFFSIKILKSKQNKVEVVDDKKSDNPDTIDSDNLNKEDPFMQRTEGWSPDDQPAEDNTPEGQDYAGQRDVVQHVDASGQAGIAVSASTDSKNVNNKTDNPQAAAGAPVNEVSQTAGESKKEEKGATGPQKRQEESDSKNEAELTLVLGNKAQSSIDSFVIDKIRVSRGDSYVKLVNAYKREGFPFGFLLDGDFRSVNPNQLRAGRDYVFISSQTSADFDAFVSELSQKDICICAEGENVFVQPSVGRTVPETLKTLKPNRVYQVYR